MSDDELKHDLASKYAGDFRTASRDDAYGSFIDGWDAARANQVEGWLTQDMGLHVANIDNLIKERDQLKAYLKQLVTTSEKLADALDVIANLVGMSADEDTTTTELRLTIKAIAEYRKQTKGE